MLSKHLMWLLGATLAMLIMGVGCTDPDGNNGNNTSKSCTFRADCAAGQRCDNGTCSSQAKACAGISDCSFDEYCAEGTCAASACQEDGDCVGAQVICGERNVCRAGCRNNEQCGQGKVCNRLNVCEDSGCTPGSCTPDVERCDSEQSPSRCVPTGRCASDVQCAAYANFVNDGNQYICGNGQQCIVKPPCQQDTDCRVMEGEICDVRQNERNLCRKGCRSDRQCALNEFCDTDASTCVVGCASDNDCSAIDPNKSFVCVELKCIEVCQNADSCPIDGQVCTAQSLGGPRVCQGCDSDSQCPLTQFCDFTRGSNQAERDDPRIGLCVDLPPDCPDDGYGGNNAIDRAFALTSFPFVSGQDGAREPLFCDENRQAGEWFVLQAVPGQVISAKIEYVTQGANLDLDLLRSDGTLLASSRRPPTVDGGVEQVRYGVATGDSFLLRVTGSLSGRKNLPFKLSVDVAQPAACQDDAFEENDTLETAAELMPSTPATGLQVCASIDAAKTDRDFYKLNVGNNQIVTITAQSNPSLGGLTILVYDSMGAAVTVDRQPFKAQFSVQSAGVYIVEIAVTNGVGNVDYDLEWTQRDNTCADIFEPNNSPQGASPITPGRYADINLCTDEDWYVIDLLPLQTITVYADYDPNQGQGFVDLRLRGPNDASLIAEYDTREILMGGVYRQKITYQAPQGGRFYIAVTLAQGLNVPYALEVQVADGPACADDPFEPNDSAGQATLLNASQVALGLDNALLGLRYCDLNQDFYAIDLMGGDQIEWVVKHTVAGGDLDAEIIGPLDASNMGPVVAVGTSTTNDETVSYTVPADRAGRYVLRVFGKSALRTSYRLLTYLNGTGPVDPDCPDLFENNDTRATARTVTPGSYSLLVCGQPLDDDWYTTCIQAGETLTIDLRFEHLRGNIDLYLYDDSGSTQFVAFSNSVTNDESVQFTTTRDQCMVYRVNTFTNVPSNTYTMNVSVQPAPLCIDDRLEPNDTPQTATLVEAPGLYRSLFKCEDDDDWYRMQVRENQKAEVYVNFDNALGDLDLEIYDGPTATSPVFSGRATTRGESVIFTAPDDASTGVADAQTVYTYYVKVITKTRARLGYDLLTYLDLNGDGNVQGPEDRTCPDLFENNDTRATAKPFPIGQVSDLSLCWQGGTLNDEDWYSVFVPAGATLTAELSFSHAAGNLELEIYRGTTPGVVAFSRSTTDDELATVTNSSAGESYIIRVYGAGVARFTTTYALRVGLSFADMCDEDAVTGDDKASAKTITTGAFANLGLCEGTEDWMRFSASANQRIIARVELNNLFGDIDVQLLNSADVVVAQSTLSGAVIEEIDLTAPAAGTYYLRVFPKNGAFIRNYYDLWFQLGNTPAAAPFCPDPYERNDSQASAAQLTFLTNPQRTDMIACGADQDWYAVALNANTDYYLGVFFDQNAGQQLDVTVKNQAGMTLATGATTGNDEILTFRPTATATYFINVENVAMTPTGAPYYMYFNAKANLCREDSFEPNNNAAQARMLPAGPGLFSLGSCSGTNADDYFLVTATQDGPLTLTIYHDAAELGLTVRAVDFSNGQLLFANTATPNRKIITKVNAQAGQTFELQILNGMGTGSYFLKIDN